MKPLRVVGWEKRTTKNDKIGVIIYAVRDINPEAESFLEGEGCEACRLYINQEYCRYTPKIDDLIIPVEGRFGIDQIYVVN